MALFLCDSHGESDASFVSERVVKAVLARVDLTLPVRRITLSSGFGISVHWVDQDFVSELVQERLLASDTLTGSSEETSSEILFRLKPVCAGCLVDWLASAAR